MVKTYEVCKVRNINAVWLLSNRYRQLVISQLLFINQINTGKYMGYQHPLYAREELQRTRRWGRLSGVNSRGKEPPGLKAVSVHKNSIIRYRKSKHGTGKQKSCGFSLGYIRQTQYWWLIKSKTDRRKLHSISIKNLLEEVSGFFRNIMPKRRRF